MKLLSKEKKRYLTLKILPTIGWLLIKFIHFTSKKIYHEPKVIPNEPCIVAFWHGELLVVPFVYLHFRKKVNIQVLISEHFDGDLIAKTIDNFGFDTIRGSSTRGGIKVLLQAIKELKNGFDLGITPDGPKGPRHEVQDGIVVMAQKTQAKIILVEIKSTSYWMLKSWDKFIIPKPFGTLEFFVSEPLDVTSLSLQEAKKTIKEGLLKHER